MPAPHMKIPVDPRLAVPELTARQSRELLSRLGPARVRLEPDARDTYARDESPVVPVRPAAVVFAERTADVAEVLAFASRENIPVTPRGGGTSKVGGPIPLHGGIVLSLERMDRILTVDPRNRLARVEPGVITGTLRAEAAHQRLFYPPDPNSLDTCTIGGNVATNAAGPCSMKYGATREHVLALELVLADGRILRLGRQTTKCSTGYDLTAFITGSEGTLAVVTEITLRLRSAPPVVKTLFATFPSPELAVAALADLYRAGIVPRAAEFFDGRALEAMAQSITVPQGAGAGLLFELDGTEAALQENLEQLVDVLGDRAKDVALAKDEAELRRLWEARRVLSATIKEKWAWHRSDDVAVPPGRLPELVAHIQALRAETGLEIVSYGHAGDGNLHINYLYQHEDQAPLVATTVERLFRKAIALGGTLSGEHGIGCTKRMYLPLEQSPALIDMQLSLKRALDPLGVLNPGKVFPG